MRKVLLFSFLVLIFFFFPKPSFAQETIDRINNFSSGITINQDTSISIKETIDYETSLQKHGIYRYIPIRYQRNNFSYTANIKDVQISDKQGQSIPYTSFKESGNLVLKIGDANITFTGQKSYILSYTTENALRRFEDHDELYWDITGEGWKIPVEESNATIVSPFATIIKVECYSGLASGNDNLCTKTFTEKEARFSYPEVVTYGKNFTVVIALEQKGSGIIFPSKWEVFVKWIKDNLLLFLIPMPLIIMFILWFKKGRDYVFTSPNVFNLDESGPKRLKPLFYSFRTPFVYEPLKSLTPGEAGAIFDERVDNQDVVAEILDLARKKYLKIVAIEKKKFLGKEQDFKFIKLKKGGGKLPEHQKYLLESIFGSEDEKKLSKLKGSFYDKMQKTKELIDKSLTSKKLFTQNPGTTRIKYIVIFVLVNIFGFFGMMVASVRMESPLPFFIFFAQAAIGFILALNMPQKTAVGTNLMLQAKGLRATINLGKWREEIKEKNLFIEEIFPFAVALGVVKKLARDMEKLNLKPPSYLENYALYYTSFNSFTNSFTSQVSSGLSYNPSSKSWSGGSGFSGGSSGGGGGGGGGGSW